MKVRRISYRQGGNIKMGDYELINPAWEETWEIEPGDNVTEARQQIAARVEKMYRVVAKRQIRAVVERRVNARDEETQDYMDEACDFFGVGQGVAEVTTKKKPAKKRKRAAS